MTDHGPAWAWLQNHRKTCGHMTHGMDCMVEAFNAGVLLEQRYFELATDFIRDAFPNDPRAQEFLDRLINKGE